MNTFDITTKSSICTFTTIMLTLLVVVGHVTRMYAGIGLFSDQLPKNGSLTFVTNFVYAFHMPAFMAVSGAVFSLCVNDLGKYTDTKAFIWNKVLRLIVPYFFFLLLLVNPVMKYINKLEGSMPEVIKANLLFGGDTRHLWFLPALFGCLLMVYFSWRSINRYPFPAITAAIVAWMVSLKVPIAVPILPTVLYYLVFFCSGYLLLQNLGRFSLIKSYSFLLSALVVLGVGCNFTRILPLKFILNLIGIGFSFGLGWKLSAVFTLTGKVSKSLAKNSFGIYLFHHLLIYLAFYFIIESEIAISPMLYSLGLIVLVIVLSIILTEGLRYLGVNLAIGETKKTNHSKSRFRG